MFDDIIPFDITPNTPEFSDNIPQGTYMGLIEDAEACLRRDDGSTAAGRYKLRVLLRDVPELGDVSKIIDIKIPHKDEDKPKTYRFFGQLLECLLISCGITATAGMKHSEIAEMLKGRECSWFVAAPKQGVNGRFHQNINPV